MSEQPHRRRRRPQQAAQEPLGQAVIGTREIYDLLIQVRDTVADLAADQEASARDIADLKATTGKHADRLDRLEKFRWLAIGAAAAAGGAAWRIGEVLFTIG